MPGGASRLESQDGLPRPCGDDADAARCGRPDGRAARPGRQRLVAARRPAGEPAGSSRSRARAVAAALGRPTQRGRLHQRGTESDNLAVKGMYWSRRDADPRRTPGARRAPSSTTRSSIPRSGWPSTTARELVVVPVDSLGRLSPEALRAAIERGAERGRDGQLRCGPTTRSARSPRSPSWREVASRVRRAVAHRRGAGGRCAAGRLRRLWRLRTDA